MSRPYPRTAPAPVPGTRRPYAAGFRWLVAAAALAGLLAEFALTPSLGRLLSFFTVQTNILAAVVLTLSGLRAWRGRRPLPPLVTGGTLLYILITGLVFHLVLDNDSSGFSMTGGLERMTGARAVASQLLHTVSPIGVTLDWLLLTAPGTLRGRYALQWLAGPLAYLVFALVRGALLPAGESFRYTYPFLNVEQLGYGGVAANSAVLGTLFALLALLLITFDHTRPGLPGTRPRTPSGNRISHEGSPGLK